MSYIILGGSQHCFLSQLCVLHKMLGRGNLTLGATLIQREIGKLVTRRGDKQTTVRIPNY